MTDKAVMAPGYRGLSTFMRTPLAGDLSGVGIALVGGLRRMKFRAFWPWSWRHARTAHRC